MSTMRSGTGSRGKEREEQKNRIKEVLERKGEEGKNRKKCDSPAAADGDHCATYRDIIPPGSAVEFNEWFLSALVPPGVCAPE